MLQGNAFLEAQGKAVNELLLGIIDQENRKHLVIDDLEQKIGHPLEKLVKIQDRSQLAADLVQQQQRVGLLHHPRIEPCIIDAYGNARRDQGKQAGMFVFELQGRVRR